MYMVPDCAMVIGRARQAGKLLQTLSNIALTWSSSSTLGWACKESSAFSGTPAIARGVFHEEHSTEKATDLAEDDNSQLKKPGT